MKSLQALSEYVLTHSERIKMRKNKWFLITLPVCLLGLVLLFTAYKVVGELFICGAIIFQLIMLNEEPFW